MRVLARTLHASRRAFVWPLSLSLSRCALINKTAPQTTKKSQDDDKVGRRLSTAASGSLASNYDAVIGSLPKGMSADERKRVCASTPMSPARGLLQEMPMVRLVCPLSCLSVVLFVCFVLFVFERALCETTPHPLPHVCQLSPPPTSSFLPKTNNTTTPKQDKVSSRSRDGRRLRRSVLKGSVVAFITAGYSGKRFVFETAHELGVKAIVLDAGDRFVSF